MAIIRYAPFNGIETFPGFRTMEEAMNRFFAEPSAPAAPRAWVPAMDIRETENELIVKADVPGVKFEDIDVKLENGKLTLKSERKFEEEGQEQGAWHRLERSYGSFERV